jgi:hypothetical protein
MRLFLLSLDERPEYITALDTVVFDHRQLWQNASRGRHHTCTSVWAITLTHTFSLDELIQMQLSQLTDVLNHWQIRNAYVYVLGDLAVPWIPFHYKLSHSSVQVVKHLHDSN